MIERIAIETEEDYQKLIAKLEEFDVKVIRTNLNLSEEGKIRFIEDECVRNLLCVLEMTLLWLVISSTHQVE